MSTPSTNREGLPLWLTATVTLTLLAAFLYNLAAFGIDGVPMATVIAGLMGAYGGFDQLAKMKRGTTGQQQDGGP